jgi:hypothetical protein
VQTTPASAVDVELTGETVGQAYAVASPWEGSSLERRRWMQIVGFALHGSDASADASAPDYSFRMALRVDGDFGLGDHLPQGSRDAETRWDRASGAYFVPGLAPARLDLMFGYLEVRRLAGGWLGFRVGRQYVVDPLGWWSFDGATLRVTTPWYVELEALGGFEQRGGLPFSTGRFEAQGVWRGRAGDFDGLGQPRASDFPGYQPAAVAPAFGVAAQTVGPSFLHARIGYRKVFTTGEATTLLAGDEPGRLAEGDELRTSSERVGGSLQLQEPTLGALRGSLAYDLYGQVIPSAQVGLDWYVRHDLTVGADVDHVEPIFDADSIFNWFSKRPSTTATARASVRLGARVELAGSGGLRTWGTEGDPETLGTAQCRALVDRARCEDVVGDAGTGVLAALGRDEQLREHAVELDGLATMAGRYRGSLGRAELRGLVQSGDRARQIGMELSGERSLEGGRYALGARASVFDFADRIGTEVGLGSRGDRSATSFGYALGTGFRPHETTRLSLEWEHAMNRLVGQRFRVLGSLELRWSP